MPMHEVVRSNLQTKLFGSLRGLSFAGNGLPERMRSTAVAFLGLTAAAGLALVAIFAQLGFPLLSPVPLPSEPSEGSAVSSAVALKRGPGPLAPENPGTTRSGNRPVGVDGGGRPGAGKAIGPTGVASPAPTLPESGGGTSGGQPAETPASSASPAPAPSPQPAQDGGAAAPAPDPSPSPKPTPTPARPETATPPPAPGNSQSSSAASHASERGLEASSKAAAEATASHVASSGTSTPEASSGNGNGKALGHGD
jgi:hypothetical protein